MYSRLRFFELKNTSVRQNIIFFIELSKVLEVVNFRFLANFKFVTLTTWPPRPFIPCNKVSWVKCTHISIGR